MASEELKKKWGTIFMGNREASVEQLNAMQEPLQREQRKKEQAEEYMERVRARAADRAREILGAAYAERQKVLEEARNEAAEQKRRILGDCDRLKAEAETAKKLAKSELAKAELERQDAEALRKNAHAEGYQAGMEQASDELHEFRLELGQALGRLMRALEWRQAIILQNWRDDLVTLVQCAAQAGAGYVLNKEHEAIMRALVFQALDLLESRKTIALRVNPSDEAQVGDLFRAARERYPELGQWIVTGDENIELGGLVAESGSGSVNLKRENFREMIDSVLEHLGLPEGEKEAHYDHIIRDIVEREARRITSLTPEQDFPHTEAIPEAQEIERISPQYPEAELEAESQRIAAELPIEEEVGENFALPEKEGEEEFTDEDLPAELPEIVNDEEEQPQQEQIQEVEAQDQVEESHIIDPSLAALEEELFPLESEENSTQVEPELASEAITQDVKKEVDKGELNLEPETLAQGGFL